ncbi:hypothetical protein BDA96_04G247800 [Sorghum bicolor]|uniref:Uncharacterized protein n=2 Tax=Sorghum bicolor TaxID=4558 RepID=A0A921R8A7_SORBI|nr:uncharacterized protein LOC8075694 [Sorghum bicolor]EES07231.1 hypothetical protein SORBI_3004G232600 [Sorghum bicolor]KAG0534075.1 hypothetical protein BDA96_04G247800 [Sorghum bicolor]|eukprot:XP_002454255.1 uncharacterized protein LOC8075694 [Sorghum bicolor]
MLHRRSRTLGGSADRAAARRAVATMKGGRGSNGAVTDLLVCFPSRAHLALMPPKAICSPSRPSASEPVVKRRHSTSRAGPMPPSGLYKSATARNPSRRGAGDVPVDDEPTSPKVTCVGQIKARPAKPKGPGGGSGGGGGGGGKKTKKATWLQALGIKKDAMALLDALHGAFRFNVAGCFGSFPGAVGVGYTSGEDEDEDEDDAPRTEKETEHGAALARWFMVLEEGKKVSAKKLQGQDPEQSQEDDKEEEAVPPANALMLMRCRSAPAKGLARRLEAEECEDVKSAKKTPEEEKEKESLVLMTYSPDFFKVSLDIAKETWIVGGDDAVLRCRSWKR